MIVFITKASKEYGYGHLVRCKNLAQELEKSGFECEIFTEIKISQWWKNVELVVFDYPPQYKKDETKSIKFILRKGKCIPIIQITDLGMNQLKYIDYLIDASIQSDYTLSPKWNVLGGVLGGHEYAILHPEFAKYNRKPKPINEEIKNIFITLGGGATYEEFGTLINKLKRGNFNIKIAPGFTMSSFSKFKLSWLYGVKIVRGSSNLAAYYHWADLAIITPGMARFEAACCGTPAIYITRNQHQVINAIEAYGLKIGWRSREIEKINENFWMYLIEEMSQEIRQQMSDNGKRLVDGKGTERIVEFIKEVLK